MNISSVLAYQAAWRVRIPASHKAKEYNSIFSRRNFVVVGYWWNHKILYGDSSSTYSTYLTFLKQHCYYSTHKIFTITAQTLLSPLKHCYHSSNIDITAQTLLSPLKHCYHSSNIAFTAQKLLSQLKHCYHSSNNIAITAQTLLSQLKHCYHSSNTIAITAQLTSCSHINYRNFTNKMWMRLN